jgi:Fe-S-cluster containining protein
MLAMNMPGNQRYGTSAQTLTCGTQVFQWVDSTTCPSCATPDTIVQGTVSLFGVRKLISIQIFEPFARLSDLVPLARGVCDDMVCEALDRAASPGKVIPCRAGCSTCCNYLVPLSIPEVIHLYEEIQSLPPERCYGFFSNSLEAARQLLGCGESGVPGEESTLDHLGQWYCQRNIPCPFLEKDLCAIYDQRPLACREHLVTTPAQWCHPGLADRAHKLELQVSVLECLGRVTAHLEGTPVEAVMLPLMLPWIQENDERVHRKWSAKKVAQCFLDDLSP